MRARASAYGHRLALHRRGAHGSDEIENRRCDVREVDHAGPPTGRRAQKTRLDAGCTQGSDRETASPSRRRPHDETASRCASTCCSRRPTSTSVRLSASSFSARCCSDVSNAPYRSARRRSDDSTITTLFGCQTRLNARVVASRFCRTPNGDAGSAHQQVITDVALRNDAVMGHQGGNRRSLIFGDGSVDDRLRAIGVCDHAALEPHTGEHVSQGPEVRIEAASCVFRQERLDPEVEDAPRVPATGPLREDLGRRRPPVRLTRFERLADEEVVGFGPAARSDREVSASRGRAPPGGAGHEGTERRLPEQPVEIRYVSALEVRPRHAGRETMSTRWTAEPVAAPAGGGVAASTVYTAPNVPIARRSHGPLRPRTNRLAAHWSPVSTRYTISGIRLTLHERGNDRVEHGSVGRWPASACQLLVGDAASRKADEEENARIRMSRLFHRDSDHHRPALGQVASRRETGPEPDRRGDQTRFE